MDLQISGVKFVKASNQPKLEHVVLFFVICDVITFICIIVASFLSGFAGISGEYWFLLSFFALLLFLYTFGRSLSELWFYRIFAESVLFCTFEFFCVLLGAIARITFPDFNPRSCGSNCASFGIIDTVFSLGIYGFEILCVLFLVLFGAYYASGYLKRVPTSLLSMKYKTVQSMIELSYSPEIGYRLQALSFLSNADLSNSSFKIQAFKRLLEMISKDSSSQVRSKALEVFLRHVDDDAVPSIVNTIATSFPNRAELILGISKNHFLELKNPLSILMRCDDAPTAKASIAYLFNLAVNDSRARDEILNYLLDFYETEADPQTSTYIDNLFSEEPRARRDFPLYVERLRVIRSKKSPEAESVGQNPSSEYKL